jgi:hypothetical protein
VFKHGSVVPDKTNIRKYNKKAMTLIHLEFFAIPSTIISMLKVNTTPS